MERVIHSIEGKKVIHWTHPLMPAEYSLCGDDLVGDDSLEMTSAHTTDKDVDCARCLEIVRAIKKIQQQRRN